ncbi:hypothetical protein SAMN02745146_0675 [Hymenobacter daecheongensis DSM 21074]|uniref:Uncharacterized protein n=1 Tax=Hymenobacter daecheongensis DSM 21074 TaxID=1121955 RepID=A0A1M6AKZ3_9BACT|nr:hypothetical protein [Hymenobacter daecheongensis]SHI37087.1 hypothetical protein SAMN02745146_0675 [Hymenobacter daecheongensis DSM 21074]
MSFPIPKFLLAGLLAAGPFLTCRAQANMMSANDVRNLSAGYYSAYEYDRVVAKAALTPEQAYFTPEWQPGTLWTAGGEKGGVAALRYNMALRLVEVRDPATPAGVRIVPVGGLRGFTLGPEGKPGSRTFEARLVTRAANSRNFFEVLTEGPLQLLLQHGIDEKEATWIAAYNLETRPASVSRVTRLFVAKPGLSTVEELPLKRKAVEKLFVPYASEVASYATGKKLSYEQVPDLVWLVNYYNTLSKAPQ